MVTAKKKVEDLNAQANSLKDEAQALEHLVDVFPDLEVLTNRWRIEKYVSSNVNARATDVAIGYNCGCCEDKPVEVWPYIIHADKKIYSNPPSFMVGERNPYTGRDDAYEDWQLGLRKVGISEAVIKIVEEYFEKEASAEDREYDDE